MVDYTDYTDYKDYKVFSPQPSGGEISQVLAEISQKKL
jgi:hypothetical protein